MTDKREVALTLGEMWLAGSSYLPRAGDHYAGLSKEAGGTDNAGARFDRYGTIPGTPVSGTFPGPVFPVWEKVRDQLQEVLAQSATNLYDAGDLVIRVAEMFAAEDEEIARGFREETARYQQEPSFGVTDPQARQQPDLPDD
jgi:hypothetical protein